MILKNRLKISGAIALLLLLAIVSGSLTACSGKLAYSGYDYDLNEYLDAGDISRIEVSGEEIERELNNRINTFRWENKLYTELADGAVADYDMVTVDYFCEIDGLKIDAFGAQDTNIYIGSGMMIPGFEDGMIGMTVGEWRDLDLTFPDEYYSDLGGKAAKYSVNVKKIYRLSELTDADCVKYTNYDTIEEMRSVLKKSVAAEKAFDIILERTEVRKYPEAEYNVIYSDITYIETLAEKQKMTVVEFLKKYGDQFAEFGFFSGMTEEEYKENCDAYSKKIVKEEMLIFHLLREMNVNTGGSAYRNKKAQILRDYAVSDVANYEDLYGEGSFESSMRYNLMLDALYKRVVIV